MKTKDGITLITLAVTIVIMLILAGTTINALNGKNWIVARSKEVREANEEGKTKEYLNFLLDDYNSSNYLQETEDGLTDYLYSLKNINMTSQGIGSGTGYIELSNGSFSVDNSMN